jgi:hypothetical protein
LVELRLKFEVEASMKVLWVELVLWVLGKEDFLGSELGSLMMNFLSKLWKSPSSG